MTGGGTATALSVVKGLRAQTRLPVRVVLADAAPDFAGRWLADGYALIPPATDPGLVDALLDVARARGACLVVPVFDLELPQLAEAAPRFEAAGVHLPLGPPGAVAICRDKIATADLFARLGLDAPGLWSREAALSAGPAAFPLFAKPRRGRASIDACRLASPAALAEYLDRVPDAIVQDFVDAPEATIDVISDRHGRFVAACPRWRQVVKAGQSYKGLTFEDPPLVDACRRVVEELGLRGPACIQCFRTPERMVLTEVNPRFGAATVLSIHAGLNGPLFLLEQALGLEPSPLSPRAGVRMLRYWQEVIVQPDGTGTVT